jgi:putative tryptophan/tyrosine transport system substrate-binding protein
MKRRNFLGLIGGAAASVPLTVRAQQPERPRRVGVLMAFAQSDADWQRSTVVFQEALEGLGWVQGRNLQIEYRWGEADSGRIQRYANELAELQPDVILGQATVSIAALQKATRTIPVVFVNVSDSIGSGFIESQAHPGGNITGFSNFEPAIGGKWVEYLKEIAPQVRRVSFMYNPDTSPQVKSYLPSIESAVRSLGLQLMASPVRDNAEIERAIEAIGREPGGGLVLPSDVFTFTHRDLIIGLATQRRLAAVYPFGEFARSGGLISYGVDLISQFGQAAPYVDRILKGEKAGELPVQAPTKFELIVNVKAAKALGLDVPQTLFARADEVIE